MPMPRPVEDVAQDIVARLRHSGKHVATVRWPLFYELAGRERVYAPFMESLGEELKKESILMMRGVAVVAFVSDYDFAALPQTARAS